MVSAIQMNIIWIYYRINLKIIVTVLNADNLNYV
jgi:hypothetical protein